jgi:hypothetical protein
LDKLLQSPCSNGNKILPCLYEANEETWMMSKLSIQELKAFNTKIRVQNRKLTFFIDHYPAHTFFLNGNTEWIFLPADAFRLQQPLTRGILNTHQMLGEAVSLCHYS